jgi:hypothetical protein
MRASRRAPASHGVSVPWPATADQGMAAARLRWMRSDFFLILAKVV